MRIPLLDNILEALRSKRMKIKVCLALVCMFLFGGAVLLHAQEEAPQVEEVPNQAAENAPSLSKEKKEAARSKWYNPDYRPTQILNQLLTLSDDYSRFKMRLAISNYQTATSIMFKLNRKLDALRKKSATSKHLGESWYWQTLDRMAEEERMMESLKIDAKEDAVVYLTKAIYHMDKITKKSIRTTDAFLDLMSDIFRTWSVYQYDLGNYLPCIDILNRYVALRESNNKEIESHSYLASAYEHQERVLNKSRLATASTKEYFKKKKNEHILMVVELKHGKESQEYTKMLEIVHMDEIIAVNP